MCDHSSKATPEPTSPSQFNNLALEYIRSLHSPLRPPRPCLSPPPYASATILVSSILYPAKLTHGSIASDLSTFFN
jgi:hypothetical protein